MVEDLQAMKEGELAAALDISRRTLQNWRTMRPPRGPRFIRVGYAIRYLVKDVQAWVRERDR